MKDIKLGEHGRKHGHPPTGTDKRKNACKSAFLKVAHARSGRSGSHYTLSWAWGGGLSVGKRQSSTFLSEIFSPNTPSTPTDKRKTRAYPLFQKSPTRDLDVLARTTRSHGPREVAYLSASGSRALFSLRYFRPTHPQPPPISAKRVHIRFSKSRPRAIWTFWLALHALMGLGRWPMCRQAAAVHFSL